MTRANRNLGDDATLSAVGGGLDNFNPGGADFGVVRIVDGHEPYETGIDGSNVHQPSGGSPQWNDPIGPKVED